MHERLRSVLQNVQMKSLHLTNIFLFIYPDLSSGESEEEERVCGMSGEKVRLGKSLCPRFFPFFFPTPFGLPLYLSLSLFPNPFFSLQSPQTALK